LFLRLGRFLQLSRLLNRFDLELLAGFVQNDFIEILSLYFLLITYLLSKLDLHFENVTNLLDLLLLYLFMLPLLLFVKLLAKLLDLSPLIVADVRWNILNLSLALCGPWFVHEVVQ